jgi:hypothetical protein
MSLENVQVYHNFNGWRSCSVTLAAAFSTIRTLLGSTVMEEIQGRAVARCELFLATGQTIVISSAPTGAAEFTIVGPAAVGPSQWVPLPLVSPLDLVYVKGTGSLNLIVYFA